MKIWRGRVLWREYVHPHTHPHTQLKKSGFPIPIHTQSMRGFPVKTGTGLDNTHGTSLFAISNIEWWKYIWLYDENVVGSSLPVCCMVVLYVALLSCDDHQFNWGEQMDEVPAVSKEMAILLLCHLGRTLCFFSSWVFL